VKITPDQRRTIRTLLANVEREIFKALSRG
jgi:hypothetical protein